MTPLNTDDGDGLVPGRVTDEQFELLLAGTSIRGKDLILALHDYLVNGLDRPAALEKHGVPKSQFSTRLKGIFVESERARKLSKFYQ